MKKFIFLLSVLVSLVFAGNNVQAGSYYEAVYKKMALTEVKQIASAVNLQKDQFVKLLDLNEQRFKDLDAARFYFSDEPEMYEQAVTEITFLYNKEIKGILNSHQYKVVVALANRQPDLVTMAE